MFLSRALITLVSQFSHCQLSIELTFVQYGTVVMLHGHFYGHFYAIVINVESKISRSHLI